MWMFNRILRRHKIYGSIQNSVIKTQNESINSNGVYIIESNFLVWCVWCMCVGDHDAFRCMVCSHINEFRLHCTSMVTVSCTLLMFTWSKDRTTNTFYQEWKYKVILTFVSHRHILISNSLISWILICDFLPILKSERQQVSCSR